MKYFIFSLLSICIKLNALGLIEISKIKLPIQINKSTFCKVVSIRKDGAFIAIVYGSTESDQNSIRDKIGIVVKSNGSHFLFSTSNNINEYETNVVERVSGSGENYVIQDEIRNSTSIQNSGFTILKSINDNGYISEDFIYKTKISARFKISGQSKVYTGISSSTNNSYSQITKFDKIGNAISSINLPGYSSSGNVMEPNGDSSWGNPSSIFSSDKDPNHKNLYSSSFKDGFVFFHKVVDEDTLSINRIELGKNRDGSITATVNNSDQNILYIQSSTNLIDWNTFKTIQNEPLLEVVIPANKSKEFIRAIE